MAAKKKTGKRKTATADQQCLVVGIGASAGGLDAFKQLLRGLSDDTGMAFVLIPHLDPHHESMMAHLLSKYTSMPVVQVEEPCRIRPDQVYVIPPNKSIRVTNGRLATDEAVRQDGMRMPIDYFFRSLAEERGERAVCIVLSGTGSDGTLGLREVKAAGGLTIAQQPEAAEYDGMPRSALSSGMTDFVLPIGEMPEVLVRYARHPYVSGEKMTTRLDRSSPDHFKLILNFLHEQTQYDFRNYKKGMIDRRIQRRMGLRRVDGLPAYLELLRNEPQEVLALFNDLLIGVTRFFRDAEAWDLLQAEAIRPLVAAKDADEPLRVWVPGCSTGEEAYGISILIHEEMERQKKEFEVQLFATDIDEESIRIARAGSYPANIGPDIGEERLRRFFTEDGERFRANKRLRESCVFATQNLISAPPFSGLDLISCRNLLIYLEPEIQRKLTRLFHFALQPGGYLFLGASETVTQGQRYFSAVSKDARIHRRKGKDSDVGGSFPVVSPRPVREGEKSERGDQPGLSGSAGVVEFARKSLLERFAPPSVLVDSSGRVLYFHGQLGDYLDAPSGTPTRDLEALVLTTLSVKVRGLLRQAAKEGERKEGLVRGVKRGQASTSVRIAVDPVYFGPEYRWMLVSFEDEEPLACEGKGSDEDKGSAGDDSDIRQQLEYELRATREDLQSTIEKLETSNEELKASNEEVMSMNEELQSTNEELETSREELQSLNEELSSVNNQLEEKLGDLEGLNDDLFNLLNSTEIATIFLDTDFRIRRFTPASTALLHIIPSDEGRPISDLATRVSDPALREDARTVLDKLAPIERELHDSNGRAFIRRILPYRTRENRIEGVVLTFTDVSQLRETLSKLEIRERQQAAVAALGQFSLGCGSRQDMFEQALKLLTETLSLEFADLLAVDPADGGLKMAAASGWVRDDETFAGGIGSQAGYTLQAGAPVVAGELSEEKRFRIPAVVEEHGIHSGVSTLVGREHSPWGVLEVHSRDPRQFTVDDVNFVQSIAYVLGEDIARRDAGRELEESAERLRQLTDAIPVLCAYVDRDLTFRHCNARHVEWFGLEQDEIVGHSLAEVLGEETLGQLQPRIRKALDGESVTFEEHLPFRHGPARHVLIHYIPSHGRDGSVLGFHAMIEDISEQVRGRIIRRRLAAIVENSHYAIIGEDPEGVITSWNNAAERVTGYTADEAVGNSIGMLLEEEGREELGRMLEQVHHGESIVGFETTCRHKNGDRLDVELTFSPIPGQNVSAAGISIIMRDLSEHKRTELALLRNEEQLKMAQEAAGIGLYDWNIADDLIRLDFRVRQFWGLSEDETIRYETFMEGIHPEDRGLTEEAIRRALDPKGSGIFSVEHRVVHRHRQSICWLAATGKVSFDDGQPTRIVGTVQDITKRREAEMRLEEAADRLEEQVAERTAVAEEKAADLRLLACQMTNAEQRARHKLAQLIHDDLQQLLVAAKMRLPESDEMASREEIESISEILDRVLAKSRMMVSELSPPILREGTFTDAFEWLARWMKEYHQLDVEIRFDGDLEGIGDNLRTLLFSSTRELLFNVAKHAETSRAKLKVARNEEDLLIEVVDEGNGFDPRIVEQRKESFGLYSTRERIAAFGGRMEIESAPGEGSRFRIMVPLKPSKGQIRPTVHNSQRSGDRSARRGPPTGGIVRVLLADDHKMVREGVERLLSAQGRVEVVGQASDGQEAVELTRELRPHAVLMDVSMPRLNGIEATLQIMEEAPKTVVIGLSLYDRAELGEAIVQAGAVDFLNKDVSASTLIETLLAWFQEDPDADPESSRQDD